MIRKQAYKWHRIISLIIAIPVLLWAISGFMHPIMTNIRPSIATQILKPNPIDSSGIKITLNDVLEKNKIQHIHNFRIVTIDTNLFYQISLIANEPPVYFSARTGKPLRNGDELYASYLASQFLEGQHQLDSLQTDIISDSKVVSNHDCCDAAINCILLKVKKSNIAKVELLKSFDSEYKFINRLLPVYKVVFNRADGIRIYVETINDRFAYAVDDNRAAFDKIFSLFHNWEFLDMTGEFKYVLMAFILGLSFISTCMGVYIFFTTKAKKVPGNKLVSARNNHRWSAVFIALFTLMFSFSGAFHALEKLNKDNRHQFFTNEQIASKEFLFDYKRIAATVKSPITNISMVKIHNQLYWQVVTKAEMKQFNESTRGNDLMKLRTAAPPSVAYVNASDFSILQNGEIKYAKYLASLFSNNPDNKIQSAQLITKFSGEYGFVNKRLPVWRVNYQANHNERYYVETISGRLSVRIDDKDLIEGYSFAFLHKHHFMDWGGKGFRDFSTMFWAMAQVVLIFFGIVLWLKSRKG